MDLKIYATKDVVVGSFMQPFYLHNDEEAKRSWGMSIRNVKDIPVADLQLFKLGTFNDETGEIISDIEYLARGNDFLSKTQENDVKE